MNPTPPTPSPILITPETPPVFPCWLWQNQAKQWQRWGPYCGPSLPLDGNNSREHWTHYHPDQPTAPTTSPTRTDPADGAAPQASRDTPRVDAQTIYWVGDGKVLGDGAAVGMTACIVRDFARQLERELGEAQKALKIEREGHFLLQNRVMHAADSKQARSACEEMMRERFDADRSALINDLRSRLSDCERERDELRKWKSYAEGHGLHIALNKTSDCSEGRLAR